MSIVDIFFNKGGNFLALLENCAHEIVATTEDFESFIEAPTYSRHLDLIKLHTTTEKKLINEMEDALMRSYLTELERQDILFLAENMLRIPSTIALLAKHVIASGVHAQALNFSKQTIFMGNSASVILAMIRELKDPHSIQRVRNLYRKIIRYGDRSEDDRMLLRQDLYIGQYDPIKALALSNMYHVQHLVMERFYTTALYIMFVTMKNY